MEDRLAKRKTRSTETHCANGHPWNEHTRFVYEKTGKVICRYCGYKSMAERKGHNVRDLESWITWREQRDRFCKRGHERNDENTRVDPKTGTRICRVCDVQNRRKKIYGIDADEYEGLREKQDRKCPGCLRELSSLGPREVHIDHCHDSSVVRGILCGPCNLAVGQAKDDPEVLRRLAEYISTN